MVQVRGKYSEVEDLKRQEESRQQRILKAKEDLATAELEFENLPLYEPPKDELVSLLALSIDFLAIMVDILKRLLFFSSVVFIN